MNAVHKRAMEAAERRRSYLESEIRVSPLLVLADCQDIADGYLAEHPADDDMPVDEAWVKQILPAKGSPCPGSHESAVYKGKACDVSWIQWGAPNGLCVYVGEGIAWKAMTRRQFRQLLAGLGIATQG